MLFCSTHLYEHFDANPDFDFFPGRGGPSDVERWVLNLPLEPLWVRAKRGAEKLRGRAAFRAAVSEKLLPRLAAFEPELLLISAGFDGAAGDDGNAHDDVMGLDLTDDDFRWVTKKLCAAVGPRGAVVSVLEGGYGTFDEALDTYDRETLASGCAAHVSALAAYARSVQK